jgi:microcystin-dependent protein
MKYRDPVTNKWQLLKVIASDTLAIGSIIPFGGTKVPTNWLLCDGSAVSRTTYASLFSVIGTSFGEGDGTTTFNLPDFRDKVPVGANADGNNSGKALVNSYTVGENEEHNNIQPSLSANFIIKAFQSVASVGNVLNTKSENNTKDTYSCDYINTITTREVILYSEKIKSNVSIDLNTNGYKRLLVTCALYDYTNVNTGGVSNIIIIDLENKGSNENSTDYIATNSYAYISSNGTVAASSMQAVITVNSQKTTFKPTFYYNGNIVESTEDKYYVSKIIGIK